MDSMGGGQDWAFWMTAAGMALASAVVLMTALLRGRSGDAPAASYDLQVYRDQLSEIDRDTARGVIGEDEAARLRTEVSRRVLEADKALAIPEAGVAPGRGLALAIGMTAVALLAAVGGYYRLGAPGYPDMPMRSRIAIAEELRANRPSQAKAEAEMPASPPLTDIDPQYLDLMTKLRAAVASRPNDLQGQQLLVGNEAKLGNYAAAHAAQAQVISLKGETATAADLVGLAELRIMAAGGYVSPEAEEALKAALLKDPQNSTALYYSGLMFAQTGRPDRAFELWRAVMENTDPKDPLLEPLRAQIGDMAARAGVEYTPPGPVAGGTKGPTGADMAAAADMSGSDRSAMIEGMVGQLSERLATDGGSPQEWAQLINAYGVLGKTDDARSAWAKAQAAFAAAPEDLALVAEAARNAGVTE